MSRSKLGVFLIAVLAVLALATNSGVFPAAERLRSAALRAMTGVLYPSRTDLQLRADRQATAQADVPVPPVRLQATPATLHVPVTPALALLPPGGAASSTLAPSGTSATDAGREPGSGADPTPSGASVQPAQTPSMSLQAVTNPESQILETIYRKVNPSVVEVIDLEQPTGLGGGFGAVPEGEGSGFLWDRRGHIVTNDHVVSGADKLQVVLADGTEADATLVGTDPGGDIAVIEVDPALVSDLAPLEPADMAQVQVGQMSIAIGNPFGYQNTMTRGLVSALGRMIPSQTQFSIPDAIQTDAAINPGNSGGPLLNDAGQVIGVNDQIQTDSGSSDGVGFAIPIEIVQRIAPALIQSGQYQHAYLGITGDTLAESWAQALALPSGSKGVYVMAVTSGGPADEAGLRGGAWDTKVLLRAGRRGVQYLQGGGELITAIDGQPVVSMDDLLRYLELRADPGRTVQLDMLSNGQRQDGTYQQTTVTVTLGTRPDQSSFRSRGNGEPQA